jgi:23S rRNA pseudouridine1911/1915/1917 synthase
MFFLRKLRPRQQRSFEDGLLTDLQADTASATQGTMKDRKEFRVTTRHDRCTLSDFLADALHLSRKKTKQLLDSRLVFVNQKRIWMAKHPLKTGDRIEVPIQDNPASSTNRAGQPHVPILYQDAHCLVANKPSGFISNGNNSCETLLRQQTGLQLLTAVHRLDRDTSGCLLLAKTADAEHHLIEQFRSHQVQKQYLALIHGVPARNNGSIHTPLDGRTAETLYRVIRSGKTASLLQARITTGRTHQIRRHLLQIGHPVLGDKQYGASKIDDPRLRRLSRQMLHASSLFFQSHPNGKRIRIEAPVPSDFNQARILLIDR